MALLTKEQLKGTPIYETEEIPAPEFGGEIRLRSWGGFERDEFAKFITGQDRAADGKDPRVAIIHAAAAALSIVDASDSRMFDMNGDVEMLHKWPEKLLKRIWVWTKEHSAIGADAVESAEKN